MGRDRQTVRAYAEARLAVERAGGRLPAAPYLKKCSLSATVRCCPKLGEVET